MALQTGIGLSRLIFIVGAGYTGTVVLSNGKLSDVLAEIQKVVKGWEKGDSNSTGSDALSDQVRQLQMAIQNMGSRQITVLNTDSSQTGITSLALPAAALGVVGYGYMWWKGLSFSDLMYVTKHNMANAVASMTKHLDQVSAALAATKRHLTQRLENLDGKLDEQKEMSKLIKNEVTDVRGDLSQIGYDLDSLHRMVSGLDGKIMSLEDKQDIAIAGVSYLCNFVASKDDKMSELLKALPKPVKPRLGFSETPSLKGLKQIADTISSGNLENSVVQNDLDKMDIAPRSLTRVQSIKC
ncbi:putative GRIP/coiled-coil protein [Thalictrum thalictroides]|uniref:Putative GRIP/coiled-coil protein n=1 Tax=Thalictrum thalictroides TaxID=46969 RepID=A0A7J6X8D9_THATH|nr:putative GRIP/coiled-coil protein [Thalictrum thalictroides]